MTVSEAGTFREATPEAIDAVWRESWGLPVITVRRNYVPADCLGLELRAPGGARLALATRARDGDRAESSTGVRLRGRAARNGCPRRRSSSR